MCMQYARDHIIESDAKYRMYSNCIFSCMSRRASSQSDVKNLVRCQSVLPIRQSRTENYNSPRLFTLSVELPKALPSCISKHYASLHVALSSATFACVLYY